MLKLWLSMRRDDYYAKAMHFCKLLFQYDKIQVENTKIIQACDSEYTCMLKSVDCVSYKNSTQFNIVGFLYD